MLYRASILILLCCLSGLSGRAQNYFSQRYDTFGSCDGANYVDTIYGQYITAGFTCSSVSFYALNLRLYSLNSGTVNKTKTYHWPGSNFGAANGFKSRSGKFLLGGSRFYHNDTSLVFQWLFDENLDSVKYVEYGFLNQGNVVNGIVYDNSKCIYMAGNVYDSNFNSDILLIKTDTLGHEIWKKRIGLPNWDETALSIDTLQGKLVIGGTKGYHGGLGSDGMVSLLDTAGNMIWQRIIPSNGYGGCYIKRLRDGTILAHNRVKKYSVGSYDYYKLRCEKIDVNNNTVWAKEYYPLAEIGYASIMENNDGHIIICGQCVFPDNTVSGNVYVLNQTGDSVLYKEYRILPNSQNYFRDVVQASDKGYCFSGFVSPMNGDGGTQDIWLLKVDSNFCESNASCVLSLPPATTENSGVRLDPNPASGVLSLSIDEGIAYPVSVELIDLRGMVLLRKEFTQRITQTHLSLESVPDGIYVYRIAAAGRYLKTGKLVVIR